MYDHFRFRYEIVIQKVWFVFYFLKMPGFQKKIPENRQEADRQTFRERFCYSFS